MMGDKTAWDMMHKAREERTIELITEQFFKRWTPRDHDEAREFHRDFFMVVRHCYLEAQKPAYDHLTKILEALPPALPQLKV